MPTQSWPLARWPDGSLKWLACAAVIGPDDGADLAFVPGTGPRPPQPVTVEQIGMDIFRRVSTGTIIVDVGDRGTALIQEIARPDGLAVGGPCGATEGDGRRAIAGMVALVAVREERRSEAGATVIRRESCPGVVRQITVEQAGPVRALLRLEGAHRCSDGRSWLPFIVRLAFWTGLGQIDVVHSLVIDGDMSQESIAGLGLRCHVPLIDSPDKYRECPEKGLALTSQATIPSPTSDQAIWQRRQRHQFSKEFICFYSVFICGQCGFFG